MFYTNRVQPKDWVYEDYMAEIEARKADEVLSGKVI